MQNFIIKFIKNIIAPTISIFTLCVLILFGYLISFLSFNMQVLLLLLMPVWIITVPRIFSMTNIVMLCGILPRKIKLFIMSWIVSIQCGFKISVKEIDIFK